MPNDTDKPDSTTEIADFGGPLKALYAIRVALDEYGVVTEPARDSEFYGIWTDYSDRMFAAHDLRTRLA